MINNQIKSNLIVSVACIARLQIISVARQQLGLHVLVT